MLWFKKRHDCEIHGHKYEARYDERIAVQAPLVNLAEHATAHNLTLHGADCGYTERFYITDVCMFCGDKIDNFRMRMQNPIETSNGKIDE